MSEKKTAGAAESAPVDGQETTKTETTPSAPRFPVARLRQDCLKLFGVTPSTFDGAVHGLSGGEFTVEEMANRIKKWQSMPAVPAAKKTAKEEK